MGKTQGVSNAKKPPKNPARKIPQNERSSLLSDDSEADPQDSSRAARASGESF